MASTVTLNGGPTGGLHGTTPPPTTPTSPSSGVAPPSPSSHHHHRVESNSSFDSGQEESLLVSLPPGLLLHTPPGGGHGKKRRKQSRPVRIPADDKSLKNNGDESTTIKTTTAEVADKEREEGGESTHHQHHHHHPQGPLNLTSEGLLVVPSAHEENNSSASSVSSSTCSRNKGDHEEDDEEASSSGRGPSTFSLFPRHPFTSLFPGNVPLFPQVQSNQGGGGGRGGGTPASSASSVGSNNSCGGNNNGGGGGSLVVGSSGTTLGSLPPHRIFNPEAYCDLCNKEFCNKYFLKTHKANKHGVYSELSSPSSTSTPNTPGGVGYPPPPPPSNILQSTSTPPGPSSSVALLQHHHHQQQQLHQQLGSSSSSAAGNLVLGLSPGNTQGTSNNKGPHPPSSVLSALDFGPFQGSFGSSSVTGGGGSGRKSFCELCQKEFCNKYFLKRHKAKIHGIQDNPSSASSGRSNSSSTGSTQVTNNNASSVASTSNNNNKRFPNGIESSSSGCNNNNNNNSMRDNNGGGGGGKFPGGSSSNNTGGVLPLGLESLGLEVVTKHLAEEAAGGREEGEVMPGDDEEENSKGGGGGEGNHSKSNNEGLLQCQFCFREFSSRTSLASHLAKKHRLLVPTSFPPFLLPFPGLFPGGGGGSGGSLGGGTSGGANEAAVAALLGSESAAVAALAAGLLDSTNGGVVTPLRGGVMRGDSSGEGSFECEVCHRSFATRVLLRMHKSYFHPEEEMMIGGGGEEPSPGAASDAEEMKDDDEDLKGEGMNSRSPKEERDADSDDLRRLQTMIMELNRVSSAGAMAWTPGGELIGPSSSSSSSTLCVICNKEFYSSFFLQQHIAHYHADVAVKSESPGGLSAHSSSTPTPTNNVMNNNSITPTGAGGEGGGVRIKIEPQSSGETPKSNNKIPLDNFPTGTTLKDRLCGGDSSTPQTFLGSFGGTSSSPMLVGLDSSTSPATQFLTPGPKGGSSSVSSSTSAGGGGVKVDGKRPSPSLSRSYCTICHKELCNKYFMRTHMLKMHGISIESSTGLGGVTCDICNKELCSKYFLKVHKQNTHGIVEDGPSPPAPPPTPPVVVGLTPPPSQQHQQQQQLGLNLSTSSGESSANNNVVSLCGNNNGVDGGIKDGEGRYFYHYSESCPFCGRRFRSSKWLKTHLTSDHGEEGREKWKAMEKVLLLSSGGGGGGSGSTSSSQCRKVPQGHQVRSQQVSLTQQLHQKGGGVKNPSVGGLKTSRNGDNKGPLSSSATSSLYKGHNLTRDGNRCGFCNFSSGDLETMKTHLLKEHSAHLTSNSSRLETAAMNAAALNAAALNAVAAAGGYPGGMHGGNSSVGSGGHHHQGGWKEGIDGGGSDPLSVILSKIDGASNKLYRCTYCPFTTSILVYLYAHERTHSSSSSSATPTSSDNFVCPLCFHTFDQPESLQQHIIGHQMSGVLGGFFNPGGVPTSSSSLVNSPGGRLGFPSSSSPGQEQASPFLPLLNGAGGTGESLYWALKQNLRGGEASVEPTNGDGDETTEGGQKNSVMERGEEEEESRTKKKKRFKCSLCNVICGGRDEMTSHMRKAHRKGHLFRCRKCKFTSATYPRLVVHSKVAHHHRVSHRGGGMTLMKSTGTGTEWKFPPNPQEEDFMMQGFFLTSSEEESSEDSPFVPSLVYLPVREKDLEIEEVEKRCSEEMLQLQELDSGTFLDTLEGKLPGMLDNQGNHLTRNNTTVPEKTEKNRGPAIKLSNSGKSKNVFEGDGAAEADEDSEDNQTSTSDTNSQSSCSDDEHSTKYSSDKWCDRCRREQL